MSFERLLRVHDVHKTYPIFERPYQRLLQLLVPAWRLDQPVFTALNGIGFEVQRGESVAILGRNGSGKSTLLQIICGTVQPSRGEVELSGRVAALLELGAGFNPEFTGRENVFLNASLLGLDRGQTQEKLPEIEAFAEIGEHLDQPVKTYSSGMLVRLAFAVAAHCDPELLVIDEALAVGDMYFQQKCFRRIAQLREEGCTLLLVTHSLAAMLQLCDRALVLEGGRVVFDGDAKPASRVYLKCLFGEHSADGGGAEPEVLEQPFLSDDGLAGVRARIAEGGHRDLFQTRPGYHRGEDRLGDGRARLLDFAIVGSFGEGPVVPAGEAFRLLIRYRVETRLDRLIFGVQVRSVEGLVLYATNTLAAGLPLQACAHGEVMVGEFKLQCALLPGHYFLSAGISRVEEGGDEVTALDRRIDAISLTVLGVVPHTSGVVDLGAEFSLQRIGATGEVHQDGP